MKKNKNVGVLALQAADPAQGLPARNRKRLRYSVQFNKKQRVLPSAFLCVNEITASF